MAESPTYATWEQVRDVLTRDKGIVGDNAASIEQHVVEAQIRDAQSEIDARLAERYVVPFDPVPPLITSLTINLAAYLTHLTFRQNRDMISELNPVYLRYQRADTQLTQLQNGQMVIPPTESDPTDPPSYGSVVTSTITRPPLIGPGDFDLGQRVPYRDPVSPEYWGQE